MVAFILKNLDNSDMITDLQLKEFCEKNPNLVTRKESKNYPGLFVIKYKNKVFYDNLWTPELCEFRGLVVDNDWNVVVRPFTKVFNRHERGTDINRDAMVTAVRKVNGFMAAVTNHEKHGLIVSTTGSLDSDFVGMAKEMLPEHVVPLVGYTYLFEICHPQDPHIVEEKLGAYLIGARNVSTGIMMSERELDEIALNSGTKDVYRPEWKFCRFSDIVQETKTCKHEGFMVYSMSQLNDNVSLKIKSPYYLTKKFFARVNSKKLSAEWLVQNKVNFDEEYYPLIDNISSNLLEFTNMNEEQRKTYIQDFLKNG